MLYPKVSKMRDLLILVCKFAGFPLVVTSEYRSIEEQDKLYAQGRTTPGQIVTNARGGESFHNYKVAFDVAIVKNGIYDYNIPPVVGWIGNLIGLTWGGSWKSFVDRPHFQYEGGYTLQDFQVGKVDISKFM